MFPRPLVDSELICSKSLDKLFIKAEEELAAALERIKNAELKAGFLPQLVRMGYRNDLPFRYHQDGISRTAVDRYRSMVQARSDALGPAHPSTTRAQGHVGEAALLE